MAESLDGAMQLYQLAVAKPYHVSFHNLGLCFDKRAEYLQAARSYQQAIEGGYSWAKINLNILLYTKNLDNQALVDIGLMYCTDHEVRLFSIAYLIYLVRWINQILDAILVHEISNTAFTIWH